MWPPFSHKSISHFVAHVLVLTNVTFGQGVQPHTRPRRVEAARPSALEAVSTSELRDQSLANGQPVIRVGLTTEARSASISTNGVALRVEDAAAPDAQATLLPVARVRIEPRSIQPPMLPTENRQFRVEIAEFSSADAAAKAAREARVASGEEAVAKHDRGGEFWRVSVGPARPQADAESLQARLEEAGLSNVALVESSQSSLTGQTAVALLRDAARRPAAPATQSVNRSAAHRGHVGRGGDNKVRLAARGVVSPTRGLAVFAAAASRSSPLLDARAPLVFSSADGQTSPVRFNDKPYRGRLEVFTNLKGALTVVNVVALEDYVRGVVPNELSPDGYPALEALKAQAVAARTYAFRHLGQFVAAGFDLLPTTRSQVYGGVATEHPLATRAVEETHGIVATYEGRPIDALYTSTCGGRTEDAEIIFGGELVPYLRGHACAAPTARASFTATTIKTSREPAALRDASHVSASRAAARLSVHGFRAPARLDDDWLAAPLPVDEARALFALAARLARRTAPAFAGDLTRPPAFASALARALDGESRADVLLNEADVDYLLDFRDAADVPAEHRPDVALFLREGHLTLHPDASLRPRQPLTRARALSTLASLLEARKLFALQQATARIALDGRLSARVGKAQERALEVVSDAHLFRAYGSQLFPARFVSLVGGEQLTYHLDARGMVDYLEVVPAQGGAASDRFSNFSHWSVTLSPAEVARRLARARVPAVGPVLDLRVAARGGSRRVIDLEVVGTSGVARVRGGRVRTALGLREQLFVVGRTFDERGAVAGFVFEGRGWGHGVGMCQVGAYGLARAGWPYDKILEHYYRGIGLKRLY
ncbi:MAG: SpoIID/LytB domain-containing protein [Pyrinomonadaceae bacterium]